MDTSPPNCKYETFVIHTSSLGASSNTAFTSTFTRPIKNVVEASIVSASIRRPDVVHFPITNTVVADITTATITHAPLSTPLSASDSIIISDHTGTNADLALNQTYTVASITSPTETVLTGTALPAPMALTTSQSVAASTTATTITFVTGARTLYAGETVVVTGHTGTPQDLAMNGTFTVDADSAGTTAALTGSGMTPATTKNIDGIDTSLILEITGVTVAADPSAGTATIGVLANGSVRVGEIFTVVGDGGVAPFWDGTYTVTVIISPTEFEFTNPTTMSTSVTTTGLTGVGTATHTSAGTVTNYTNNSGRTGPVEVGEELVVTGGAAPSGTYTVVASPAPTATAFSYTTTAVSAVVATTSSVGSTATNDGIYSTGAIVTTTQPISGIYNTGPVVATTDVAVAPSSNVAYIRVEELDSHFTDFAAAGQPATTGSTDNFNFPTGSNTLRRCFGAIYDRMANRFSYKDRYQMVSQYIDPIKRMDKLQITIYDANGVQMDSSQSDGLNFLTFRFTCLRHNLC